jgi:hypothetical protein
VRPFEPDFRHLVHLSGRFGTFEHAELSEPRVDAGHCTDDVARVLIVTSREGDDRYEIRDLAENALKYILRAQDNNGLFRNRRTAAGEWTDLGSNRDCWGRAMWALGTAAVRSTDGLTQRRALDAFERGSRADAPWSRTMAFAALGAIEILRTNESHEPSLTIVNSALPLIFRQEIATDWRWPEDRLRYSNASLPEALLGMGIALDDADVIKAALRQLRWLLHEETKSGYLSVTPVGGRVRGEPARLFDQQPLEVAAMADACASAWHHSRDDYWLDGLQRCGDWFEGINAAEAVMYNIENGGGYDGLTPTGPNRNQGAESALAYLSTVQLTRQFCSMAS